MTAPSQNETSEVLLKLADILSKLQAAYLEYQTCPLEDASDAQDAMQGPYDELLELLSPRDSDVPSPDIHLMLQQEREARERLEKALANVHAMAGRQIHRAQIGKKLLTDDWRHVKRFCEESGIRPSILRAALAQPAKETMPCSWCGGSGGDCDDSSKDCDECNGSGRVPSAQPAEAGDQA